MTIAGALAINGAIFIVLSLVFITVRTVKLENRKSDGRLENYAWLSFSAALILFGSSIWVAALT